MIHFSFSKQKPMTCGSLSLRARNLLTICGMFYEVLRAPNVDSLAWATFVTFGPFAASGKSGEVPRSFFCIKTMESGENLKTKLDYLYIAVTGFIC